jgi:hypothetical protein
VILERARLCREPPVGFGGGALPKKLLYVESRTFGSSADFFECVWNCKAIRTKVVRSKPLFEKKHTRFLLFSDLAMSLNFSSFSTVVSKPISTSSAVT